MSRKPELEYGAFQEAHLESAVALCRSLSWESYVDPAIALRAFSAPGAITWTARDGAAVVGLAHLLTDGLIQAHLSLVGVLPVYRRRGIARTLLVGAFGASGSKWLDLVADPGSESFYRSLLHDEKVGFRVYPRKQA